MPLTLLGSKVGMTRRYTEEGKSVPVTVIEVGPCVVTQVKTEDKDGYSAVQIAYQDVKPRRSTQALIAHDAKAGAAPKRHHREFLVNAKEAENYTLGQTLTVADLEGLLFVDVAGVSKGKGFQGVMKRHHFKGMFASHGTERMHRHGGSIGGHATNRGTGPKPKKGKRMGGHMGAERVTVRSLDVVMIDKDNGLLLVKGPVPGHNRSVVEIRTPTRLYAPKARKQSAAAKGK